MDRRTRPTAEFSVRAGLAAALLLGLMGNCEHLAHAQPPKKDGPAPKTGVLLREPKAFAGYTLVAPMNSTKTYLLDLDGHVVQTWASDCTPALSAYLLENGHLLRPGSAGPKGGFGGPGMGGSVQEFTWDGELVWDFTFNSKTQTPHHDITRLPNGNILMVVSDRKTTEEAVAAGRRPETVTGGTLMADSILEVRPTGKTTGEVVWEWHVWDHLVQDHDRSKANYARVAAHPELVDVNYGQGMFGKMVAKKDDLDKLRGIGYLGGPGAPGGPGGGFNPSADWTHINSVAYNADLDQIVLSVHGLSEIWIIDHGTTKAEAAGHSGGRQGKGGDLLCRWGNPQAYRSGTNADQRLFQQHNAHWIPKGHPGEGHLLVFNNGGRRPDGSYSSVDEIVLPVDKDGRYAHKPGLAFAPKNAEWSYTAPNKSDFFAMMISGAQRLPNGNTLVCSGPDGTVFEVTPEKEVVWKFVLHAQGGAGGPKGRPPFGGFFPPTPGQILPAFLQDRMGLTPEQRKQVEQLQQEVDGKLQQILTDEQKKQLADMRGGFGRGMFGGPGGPGGLFRSYRYGADYPGLAGRTLMAGKKLEELESR